MIEVNPDIEFINELKMKSGSPLSICMQCGACTAVCRLSETSSLFPRKEIIWTIWGLKDRLIADPDLWLCYQCGDCTATCPRGVKPGDVLSSLRRMNYLHYAIPGFLAKMLDKPIFLPLVIGIPSIIISAILLLAGRLKIPEGEVNYSKFFPHIILNISFSTFFLFSLTSLVVSLRNFWEKMKLYTKKAIPSRLNLRQIMRIFMEILTHKQFRSCEEQKHRFYAHFLVFWGFILLLVVTFYAILSTIFFSYPLDFWNPVKVTGNIAGISIIIGCTLMIIKRLLNTTRMKSTYSDWIFLISLYLLTITGFILEWGRFKNWLYAYHIYFFHLILVWMVILYLPYTKFAHIVYRFVALIFKEYYTQPKF